MSEIADEIETRADLRQRELSEANDVLQEQIAGRKGAEERFSESEEHYLM